MDSQSKIAGVVLAGGRARRMSNQDKGLVIFKGRPMVSYALDALVPVADYVLINANRNIEQYRQFGWPVICDQTDNFDGPLAGILTAMIHTKADIFVIIPCDSPFIKAVHLQKLLSVVAQNKADLTIAYDGERMHPVFLAINPCLQNSLHEYLAKGQRKVMNWVLQQNFVLVDFKDEPEIFNNINSMDDLVSFETGSTNDPLWNTPINHRTYYYTWR